ncbi:MAG TPA: ATPase, T2SS/T4P/T4SS family [Phycisphaerae bacterium]|nr:ATPase, T2SS/T4P/T4SS family [Phycisphaerae bacterium]
MAERLFTTYQVAEMLGQTPGTIVEWIQQGLLPVQDFPNGPSRVPESALVEFLNGRGQDARRVLSEAPADNGVDEIDVHEVLPRAADDEDEAVPRDSEREGTQGPAEGLSAEAQVADAILTDAAAGGADQAHLEPTGEGLTLRLRVGGLLREKGNFRSRLPAEVAPKLAEHFKSLARLDVGQCRRPQSGSFTRRLDGREMEIRLSTCPTSFGEKMFIRLVDPARRPPALSELGLGAQDELRLRGILAEPGAMVIVAGPPRRDRARALVAIIAETMRPELNIVTVGRGQPELAGANQSRMDPLGGFTYAEAMKVFEAQDADVIMIEDLRDPETAVAAIEAARDGRIVIAGMIAADAAACVAGLLAMGVEPWPLAGTLRAIVEYRPGRKGGDAAGPAWRPVVWYVEGELAAAIRAGNAPA